MKRLIADCSPRCHSQSSANSNTIVGANIEIGLARGLVGLTAVESIRVRYWVSDRDLEDSEQFTSWDKAVTWALGRQC